MTKLPIVKLRKIKPSQLILPKTNNQPLKKFLSKIILLLPNSRHVHQRHNKKQNPKQLSQRLVLLHTARNRAALLNSKSWLCPHTHII